MILFYLPFLIPSIISFQQKKSFLPEMKLKQQKETKFYVAKLFLSHINSINKIMMDGNDKNKE